MEDCQKYITKVYGLTTTYFIKDGILVAEMTKHKAADGYKSIKWYLGGQFHRVDGPAVEEYHNGKFDWQQWYLCDQLHRVDGPASTNYMGDNLVSEEWYLYGQLHRIDGPAIKEYEDGKLTGERWYLHGEYHRADGPAVLEYEDGKLIYEAWYLHGQLHSDLDLVTVKYIGIDIEKAYNLGEKNDALDDARTKLKTRVFYQVARALPLPISDAIYWHYCYQ